MNRLTILILIMLTGFALSSLGTAAAETVELSEGDDLASAAQSASPGDTLVLGPGNYSANIRLMSEISLQGAGATETTIFAASPNEPVIDIDEANRASVGGVTVTGSSVAGIRVTGGENVSVSDVQSTSNRIGVLVEGTTGVRLSNSTASDSGTDGIRVRGSGNGLITNNVVRNNAGTGISLDDSPDTVIRGNEATGNAHGVFVISSDRSTVLDNRAVGNDWNGILVWNSRESTVEDNVALRNRYGVVVDESPDSTVSGNVTYEATPLNVSVLIGLLIAGVTYVTGWHIFRASEPGHAAKASRTHRILGFTTLATYLVVASLALKQNIGMGLTLFLVLGLGLYLAKIWSINTGRNNLGPLIGSTLILKWVGLFLFFVIQV